MSIDTSKGHPAMDYREGASPGAGPDIVEGVRRLKSQDGPGLVRPGSSTLTTTLLYNMGWRMK